MNIVDLGPHHVHAIQTFFGDLPEGDRTFVKEELTDADTIASFARPNPHAWRWIALDANGSVLGFVALLRLSGWSDHVGEIRLVVHPNPRGRGVGRGLARHALLQAVHVGLSKVVVEVVAEQQSAAAMFTALGFEGEALLRDHIRDRSGQLRDLIMLAHYVQDTWSSMRSLGLVDELVGEAATTSGQQ